MGKRAAHPRSGNLQRLALALATMTSMTRQEVARAARHHNIIPLVAEVAADLLTPVSALLRLRRVDEPAFLLESVTGGERVGRYSFLGVAPYLTLRSRGNITYLARRGRRSLRVSGSPLDLIEAELRRYRPLPVASLPRFSGGAVGYFSYDCARYVERLPTLARADGASDDIVLMFYDTILAFDHAKQRILVIANVMIDDAAQVGPAYRHAERRLATVLRRLAAPIGLLTAAPTEESRPGFLSNTSPSAFRAGVRRIKGHIRAGDAFQVVLSQRWHCPFAGDPLDAYRALRRLNPSPYMYFLALGGNHPTIAGASPEMLLRVEGDRLETRPIAGTRPRGATPQADAMLERGLVRDRKEQAEHVMLVDLGRNDLGRVAVPGTVTVPELAVVERYSHVMHLVSSVRARLSPGISPLRALMSAFPAGTVSGAPKVRAMEIIEGLEPERRGIYGGAVTYFDFHGSLDSCITIRTLVFRDGRAIAQAGAGIVADSDPERELAETQHKAQVLFRAVAASRPASTAATARQRRHPASREASE